MCYNLILFSVCAQMLSCVWLFETLWTVAPRLFCPWDSRGKNTEVGCHVLLQGIFTTQTEPASPVLADGFFTTEPLGKLLHDTKHRLVRRDQIANIR